MKYLTETKVCTPNGHVLGIIDGDRRVILCGRCKFVLGNVDGASIGGKKAPINSQ